MSDAAERVDEVDLSAPAAPAAPPPRSAGRARHRWPRRRALLAVGVVVTVLVVGSWHQHRALDAERALAAEAAEQRAAAVQEASSSTTSDTPDASAASSATAAAVRALAAADPAGSPPAWGAADVGARGGRLGGPLDLQVVGTWPASDTGAQRTGFRLLTGLPAESGAHPCGVSGVRTGTWPQVLDPRAGTTCEVRSAGERGTAVRTGTTGQGTSRVQVREVVLVSGGRAAVAAAWSTGSADPPLDLPALGAVAAAVVATAEPS